jgi:sec-independent protein translocase protein TatB
LFLKARMFDLGFSELMLIALVALVVIGPERLPRVARTMGHLAGRLQRYVADVKADINREVELDELKKMRDSMQEAASGMESSFNSELQQTESELNAAADASAQGEVSTPPQAAGSIEEKQKQDA